MFQVEGENFPLKKKKTRRFAALFFLLCGFERLSAVNGVYVPVLRMGNRVMGCSGGHNTIMRKRRSLDV